MCYPRVTLGYQVYAFRAPLLASNDRANEESGFQLALRSDDVGFGGFVARQGLVHGRLLSADWPATPGWGGGGRDAAGCPPPACVHEAQDKEVQNFGTRNKPAQPPLEWEG